MAKKVIITAAVTGGAHTPSMSPYLPLTPDQIIEDAVMACEAGAASVHVHSRNPENGMPNNDVETFRTITTGIKKRCNAVICTSTGGTPGKTLDERLAVVPALKPEQASCNAGSVNFCLSFYADKLKAPKFDWEVPYLKMSYDFVFTNTFHGLEYYIKTMYENHTNPEFEVFDFGMIYNLSYFLKIGLIKKPIYIQFVLGTMGGIMPTVDNLCHMVKVAKDELGSDINWSVCAGGRAQFLMTPAALAMGGNVRVGLEDNLHLRPGVLAKSSAEQVTQIREIAERMGFEIATPDEARQMLGLKGMDKVNF